MLRAACTDAAQRQTRTLMPLHMAQSARGLQEPPLAMGDGVRARPQRWAAPELAVAMELVARALRVDSVADVVVASVLLTTLMARHPVLRDTACIRPALVGALLVGSKLA